MNEWQAMWTVAMKDLRTEWRSKAATVATVFFSAVTLLVLAFALGRDESAMRLAAPGVLWVALAFAGLISSAQSYQHDLEEGAFDQLLTLPIPRVSIFHGKLLAHVVTMSLLGVLLVPVTAVLFDAPIQTGHLSLLATVVLGTLGFSVISMFYAALTANLRARESLLPVLMFPVVVPILLAAVRATEAIVTTGDAALAGDWLQLLLGFDLIYLVVTSAVYHVVVEE